LKEELDLLLLLWVMAASDWPPSLPPFGLWSSIDPVFKESQAERSEVSIESMYVIGTGLGRRGTSPESRQIRSFGLKDIAADVEQLALAPGKELFCLDWHPTCTFLMQNGECIERPQEMGVICQVG